MSLPDSQPMSLWSLPPQERAAFATAARLIACLATESLLPALYVPIAADTHLTGAALVLAPAAGPAPYRPADVFAVVPLRHVPVFRPASTTDIALLDPLDMLPFVFELRDTDDAAASAALAAATLAGLAAHVAPGAALAPAPGPLHLWQKYAAALRLDAALQQDVAAELASSVLWQQHAYEHPPPAPAFDSPSIAWEQSIIEGHPTHPMHKARRLFPPMPPLAPGAYDWLHPVLRLVAVPRARMHICGPWDALVAPVCAAAAARAAAPLAVPPDHVLVPVHELQLPNIRARFPDARILPPAFAVPALAQQSIRSVLVPAALPAHSLKLALGVRLTSAVRTISPASAHLGPRFSRAVLPRLAYDRALLVVQRELASAVYAGAADPDAARHLAGIVREEAPAAGERVIVCTALTEVGHGARPGDEVPLVERVFGLDTEAKRLAWLDTFADLYLRAFLPPALANGVAFEAHPQNTLARFDAATRRLTGFAVRDFGGLRIHLPTLAASTGLPDTADFVAPGHSVLAPALADVHARLYHTLVHNTLQTLVRALRLHHGAAPGWARVRAHLRAQVPAGHALAALWLGDGAATLPGKCFMRMRLQGLYRTHLHGPFPNLILYEGDGRDAAADAVADAAADAAAADDAADAESGDV